VAASGSETEGWGVTDTFTVVLEIVALNATVCIAYCREWDYFLSLWNIGARPARIPVPIQC